MVSTQFDGPGHIGVRTSQGDFFYNGQMAADTYTRGAGGRVIGMGGLGRRVYSRERIRVPRCPAETAAAYKGINPLPIPRSTDSPGIVTADDVRGILQTQGLSDIGEGDCVFLYTGHGDLWSNEVWPTLTTEQKAQRRQMFNSGEPGFGISACEYFAERTRSF